MAKNKKLIIIIASVFVLALLVVGIIIFFMGKDDKPEEIKYDVYDAVPQEFVESYVSMLEQRSGADFLAINPDGYYEGLYDSHESLQKGFTSAEDLAVRIMLDYDFYKECGEPVEITYEILESKEVTNEPGKTEGTTLLQQIKGSFEEDGYTLKTNQIFFVNLKLSISGENGQAEDEHKFYCCNIPGEGWTLV